MDLTVHGVLVAPQVTPRAVQMLALQDFLVNGSTETGGGVFIGRDANGHAFGLGTAVVPDPGGGLAWSGNMNRTLRVSPGTNMTWRLAFAGFDLLATPPNETFFHLACSKGYSFNLWSGRSEVYGLAPGAYADGSGFQVAPAGFSNETSIFDLESSHVLFLTLHPGADASYAPPVQTVVHPANTTRYQFVSALLAQEMFVDGPGHYDVNLRQMYTGSSESTVVSMLAGLEPAADFGSIE